MNRVTDFFLATRKRSIISVLGILAITFLTVAVIPPASFPRGGVVTIPEGSSVQTVGEILEQSQIIRSSIFYTALVSFFGAGSSVRAGTYGFEEPISVFHVVYRTVKGDTGLPLIKVTIPEGSTVRDIGRILSLSLSSFDEEEFIEKATGYEGYLYPETYLFTDGVTPETVINTMRVEFERAIEPLSEEINLYSASIRDVVIMASLLEREARQYETKQIVAGILWKRLEINMPLQVDAVFGYIYGVDTFSPTFDQLTATDSPYNTYKNKGLPPGPIANPGFESLKAAVNPIETPYLFYLTGSDGRMHYGRTFEEHVANRRFLR